MIRTQSHHTPPKSHTTERKIPIESHNRDIARICCSDVLEGAAKSEPWKNCPRNVLGGRSKSTTDRTVSLGCFLSSELGLGLGIVSAVSPLASVQGLADSGAAVSEFAHGGFVLVARNGGKYRSSERSARQCAMASRGIEGCPQTWARAASHHEAARGTLSSIGVAYDDDLISKGVGIERRHGA